MNYNSFTTFSDSRSSLPRPSIVEVIEQSGVHLRRAGREFLGLCPFHSEKTPSFYVNENKGLFYCHGCGAKGNVFGFVMQDRGVGFKEACAYLGSSNTPRLYRPQRSKERQASEVVTSWASATSLALSTKMRTLLEQARLARACLKIKGADVTLESCERQWEILNILDEDLFNFQFLMELWTQRETVEAVING